MKFIDNQEKLDNFVDEALKSNFVCFDTEFERENTYFPKLCLMQFQLQDDTYLLYPEKINNYNALASLMCDANVCKVVHAGKQDVEIILNLTNVMPAPIFDTQIAGSYCDGLNQCGLGTLLHHSLNVKIAKSEGFTDWSQRPLSDRQIKYAVEDVIFLPQLYEYQKNKLEKLNRLSWMQEEGCEVYKKENFEIDIEDRYLHLKHVTRLKGLELARAKEVCSWRENQAISKNIPRKKVLSDEQIVEICKRNPKSVDSLFEIRSIRSYIGIEAAREILLCLKKASYADIENLEVPDSVFGKEKNVDEAVHLMMAVVKKKAEEFNISQMVIANMTDLAHLARGHIETSKVMQGWRKDVVGDDLIKLLDGKLSLTLDDNELRLHHID